MNHINYRQSSSITLFRSRNCRTVFLHHQKLLKLPLSYQLLIPAQKLNPLPLSPPLLSQGYQIPSPLLLPLRLDMGLEHSLRLPLGHRPSPPLAANLVLERVYLPNRTVHRHYVSYVSVTGFRVQLRDLASRLRHQPRQSLVIRQGLGALGSI